MVRDHELSVHVRGALANGCTNEEIREALLQVRNRFFILPPSHLPAYTLTVPRLKTSIYAGVPCAVNATRIASRILQKEDVTKSSESTA